MISRRLFDIFLSSFVLVVIFPLLTLLAMILFLQDMHQPLFMQKRIGRQGRNFLIIKLRTMRVSGSGPSITMYHDNRITLIGSVLRLFKLDELPQFFNVLVGHMSLIGPRPEVPYYLNSISPANQSLYKSLIPGITDPASLVFRNEGALFQSLSDPVGFYIDEILPAKISISHHYSSSRTLLTDIRLLFDTFVCSFLPPVSGAISLSYASKYLSRSQIKLFGLSA